MKSKKILAILFSALLAFSVMAGCGGDKNNSSTPDTSKNSSVSDTSEDTSKDTSKDTSEDTSNDTSEDVSGSDSSAS